MARFILLSCVLLLASCTLVARQNLENAKTAYQDCLRVHPGDVSLCEAERLTFQAELQAYGAQHRNRAVLGVLVH